ncbi:hypothetical protein RJ639_044652 [Escallonia herrerae]|uniref:LOB domain-containing protein n=1 Tax=Escallonia herrerae TaxID=1293975 RepID=A0AA89B592_9ASTE|nr:hypothetical protein RJ639_044652 [Escallonia herrerae]
MQRNNGVAAEPAACASCRHQRKKCNENCVLAPFFPVDKGRDFQAVHKVFGVSNVTKIVRSLGSEEDKRRAVESLTWEARWWQKDPVLGPYGAFKKVSEDYQLHVSHCRQIYQVPRQGGVVCKPAPGIIWDANTGMNMVGGLNNDGSLSFAHNNGAILADSRPYGYPPNLVQNLERARQERENGSACLPQQQQQLNGLNQQYFLPGKRKLAPVLSEIAVFVNVVHVLHAMYGS